MKKSRKFRRYRIEAQTFPNDFTRRCRHFAIQRSEPGTGAVGNVPESVQERPALKTPAIVLPPRFKAESTSIRTTRWPTSPSRPAGLLTSGGTTRVWYRRPRLTRCRLSVPHSLVRASSISCPARTQLSEPLTLEEVV